MAIVKYFIKYILSVNSFFTFEVCTSAGFNKENSSFQVILLFAFQSVLYLVCQVLSNVDIIFNIFISIIFKHLYLLRYLYLFRQVIIVYIFILDFFIFFIDFLV